MEYILFFRKSKSITRGNMPVNSNWSCMGGRKLGCIFRKALTYNFRAVGNNRILWFLSHKIDESGF